MDDHPNLHLMRRTLDAFRAGDLAALTQIFSADLVWRVPGNSRFAGEHHGHDGLFTFLEQIMELTDRTFRVESLDILANDAGGFFLDHLTAERNGRTLDIQLALHVKIRDGRIVEGVDHFFQEHLWDAFWE